MADWYDRWYGVQLDPATEIQPLTGSKEGILLLSLAFLNPGDKVLVPNPGYPTYTSATRMCEAELVKYDLVEADGWYPDFDQLESMDLTGVKLMWVNYPNMPTGAPARRDVFEKLVDFARRHGILLVNDNPYGFILNEPQSILSVPGARECCLEMNSLSKSHNMAGWRVGMMVGAADVIRELLKVKTQMDSGMFRGIQEAAVKALQAGPEWYDALNAEYRRRQGVARRIMDTLGCTYDPTAGGLYVWGRVPSGTAPTSCLLRSCCRTASSTRPACSSPPVSSSGRTAATTFASPCAPMYPLWSARWKRCVKCNWLNDRYLREIVYAVLPRRFCITN